MDNKKIATLYVYKGSNGLPSIDPKCLQILFYLRLNPCNNIRVKTSGFTTTPILPALEYDGKLLTAQESIFKKLDELTHSPCDKLLGVQHKSRIISYKVLTSSVLEDAFTLSFWGYDENSSYLAKLYGSEKYFPFGIVFARRLNAYTQDLVHRICEDKSLEVCAFHANGKFENYLNNLTCLLDGTNFILGDKPCSLDAHICGYLAPLLVLKFPNSGLFNVLKKFDKVCKYVKKFVEVYGDKSVEENVDDTVIKEVDNDRAPTSLVIFAGTVAFMAMVGYGIMNDIIRIK